MPKPASTSTHGAVPPDSALPPPQVSKSLTPWTFLTNHAHVLLCLSRPGRGLSLREVATMVGITERAVQRIVQELEAGGVILRQRQGRRNVYSVIRTAKLRHPIEAHCTVGQLIDLTTKGE